MSGAGRGCAARLPAALCALGVTAAVVAWPGLAHPAQAVPATVSLGGDISWDVTAETLPWKTAVYDDTNGAVSLSTSAMGDQPARAGLAGGGVDFAISGTPFQPDDQNVIGVPIMPTGLEFLYNSSYGGQFGVVPPKGQASQEIPWGPQGTNVVPWVPGKSDLGAGCDRPSPTWNGCPAINVPANNLAAMVSNSAALDPNSPNDSLQYKYWGDPSIWSTWPGFPLVPGDSFVPSTNQGPFPQFLWDGYNGDDNYYVQKWFNLLQADTTSSPGQLAPEEHVDQVNWQTALAGGWTADPTDAAPTTKAGGANSLTTLLNTDASSGTPVAWGEVQNVGSTNPPTAGNLAMAPPSGWFLVDQAEAAAKSQGTASTDAVPELLSLPNAHGDFVAPTPQAIEAGVNAGAQAGENACSSSNTNAMYATTHSVAGAYPLTWVDCLYVPKTGLSLATTDAMAGFIRYLITDGQNVLEPSGDGRLNPTLVNQARALADQVVTDNCPSAGGKVVSTATPTAYTPISPGVQALGAVDECEPVSGPSGNKTPPTSKPASTPTTPEPGGSPPTTYGSPTTATGLSTLGGPGFSNPGADVSGPGSGSAFGTGAGLLSGLGSGSALGSGSSESPDLSLSGTLAAEAASLNGTSAAKTATSGSGQRPSGQSGGGSGQGKATLTASIAANLPIPLIGAGQTIDKLSALLLGGLLFLGARSVVRRMLKARRA